MRTDCLWNSRAALLVGVAAMALVACGSSKKSGSTIHTEGGAGNGGSGGSATGGTGGVSMGGSAGQGGTAGQSTGGAGGQAAGGSGNCSDLGPTAGCKTCLETHCCADSAACAANADCKAFIQCKESCTPYYDNTTACAKACLTKYPNGPGADYNGIILCTQNNCASACTYP